MHTVDTCMRMLGIFYGFDALMNHGFLMLHFLKLYFILLRFFLKFKSLIEILRRRAELEIENRDERFYIIIGDLADPMEGGPTLTFFNYAYQP